MFLDELRQLRDRLVRASGNARTGALPQDELASIAAGMEGLAFQIGALLPDPRRRAALYTLSFMPSGSVMEVLEHAARLMAEGLGVERIKVLEMLPDGDLLVRAGVGWPPGFVGQVRDRGELGSQAGYTLMTGEGLNVEDIREETRFAFPEAEAMRDVRSSITVPIPGKHRPYGVLEADSVDPKFFKESDLRFMSIAANVIGGAISQVRAERALNVQRAIGLAVAGADGIGEAAAEVLAALGAGLEFTVAGLWCVEPDGEHMGLHHAWTAPSFTLGYPMTGHLFTRGVGRIGRVWEREEPLWSADMSAEGAAVRQAALKERGLSAGVCFPVLGRDGVLAVIELFKDEAYEPDADMLAVLGTIADQLGVFMERVEAERRWRERERDFRALVENSPDLISRFDRDLRRVYANPAAEAVLRRSDVSPLGGLAGEGLPEGARVDDWWVAAQRALATGQEQTADIYFPLDDEVHIFQTRIIPILSESGAVELVFSVGRDITGMKRAEEAADSRYQQVRALVQAAPIGIMVADAATRTVILSNREMERLINRSRRPGDDLHSPRSSTFRRLDGSELMEDELPLRRTLDKGAYIQAEEYLVEHPDGSAFPIIATSSPVLDSRGQVVAAILVLQDVTRLRELDRLRTDFLGMVGHELRTPLAIVRLAVSALLTAPDTISREELEETLHTVDDQAARMATMISSLRDMAQIQAGVFSVVPEPGDLRALLLEAKEEMAQAGVEWVEFRLPDTLPPVPMDHIRVLQVVENLLSNAGRYGTKGAPIIVEAELRPQEVAVHVRNHGKGIPDGRQAVLFRKFSRLDRSERSGTGLGLAISRGIVEAHGGRIWVDSSATAPVTTFSFSLPLESPAKPSIRVVERPVRRPQRAPRRPAQARARILAVDDETNILRHLKQVLDRSGYETLTTSNPGAVADLVARERPDIVLLDVMMPGASGLDVFERIKPSGVPVIFISGAALEEDKRRADSLGAAGFLAKPVSQGELTAAIERALNAD